MKKHVLKTVGKTGLTMAVMPVIFGVGTALANEVETLPENTKDIVVLHTNDIHGRMEEDSRNKVIGLAKLDTVIKEEQAKDQITVVVDAGDAFQGLPISNSSSGQDMLEIMNNMDYDAMAVGNHEFDFSLKTAKEYKERLKYPLLSANTYIDGVRVFEAHTVVDKDKSVVGDEFVVIGVTTPETATKTHPNNIVNVEFKDPITEVTNVIKEVEARAKAENVEYRNYIVLAHLGIDATTPEIWRGSTLAKALSTNSFLVNKNVIVIDGHSHTVHSEKFGNVIYNQTGSYLNNIGKVALSKNAETTAGVISYADVKDKVPTANIEKMVADVKAKFVKENSVVVVEKSPVLLEGDRNHVRVLETNLGNVIADSIYTYGQTGFNKPTDIAVVNGGGIRATIQKDTPITKGDIISVLPFGNIISQIEVTGQQIKDMFNKSLSADLELNEGKTILDANGMPKLSANGGFLQVAGARVYYDTTKEKESRILKIEVLNKNTGKYDLLDLNKVYYLATNDFLAAGGDGYTMLGGARSEGLSMDAVFAMYLPTADLTKYTVVNPNERLVIISEEEFAKLQVEQQNTDNTPKKEDTPKSDVDKEVKVQDNKKEVVTEIKKDSKTKLPKTGLATTSLSLLGMVLFGAAVLLRKVRR